MNRKQKPKMEYRYYEVPPDQVVLALLGEKWKQNYGRDIDYLHYHNLFEIGYCYEGDGTLTLNEQEVKYQGDMFSLIPKNYPHTTNSLKDHICSWEYLFFDVEEILQDIYKDNKYMMEHLITRINRNAHLISIKDEPQIAQLIRLIIKTMSDKNEMYVEETKGLMHALLIQIARYNKNREEKVDKNFLKPNVVITPALTYIGENYMKQMKVKELAALCHISETHFRRIFAESMHLSPIEYINFIRVKRACAELKTTSDSISAIANRTGFVSLSTFNRNFHRIMGISPQQWRKSKENYERKLLNYDVKIEEGW